MAKEAQPAQTNQVNKVELPAWVNDASQQNWQMAKDVAGRPLQQFAGPDVADPSTMTTEGYGMLKGMLGRDDATYGKAQDLYSKSAGMPDIQSFLNPYTAEVEKNAITNANISLDKNLAGAADAAQRSGAWGGSRGAVEQAVTRSEGIRNIGDLTAQLRKQGFDTALGAAQTQQVGERSAAAGMVGTAGARQTAGLTDVQSMLSAGGQEQAQRQSLIDAAKAKFTEARNYPIEQLNLRLAALGMSPYGKTETTNKTATSEDKGPDWATIGLGALKAAPAVMAMFSDREAKTDIKKLTDGPVPLYAYRYKDDPKSYPKVVGPMAQDIEKMAPRFVKKIGKHRTVDINNLMEALS